MITNCNLVQLQNPLPALPKANALAVDANFGGTPLVRLTDQTIDPNTLQTKDYATNRIWNNNDTYIFVRNQGSLSRLMSFNPATMQGAVKPYTTNNDVAFSHNDPQTFYALNGTQVTKNTLNESGDGVGVTLVCDFGSILPFGYKVAWSSGLGLSVNDNIISVTFSNGNQNTAIYACSYSQEQKKFRMLNTQTGAITGQWGQIGQAKLTSAHYDFPFTLHEITQAANGKYVALSVVGTADTLLVWDMPTLEINELMMTGHTALGMMYAFPGGAGGGQLLKYPYSNLNQYTKVVPNQNLPANQNPPQVLKADKHYGFGKLNPLDNSIIWASSADQESVYTSAWQDEVFGYDVATGTVYRACHTFNSGKSSAFITANAIACPSQTGNFVAVATDWMQSWLNKRGDVVIAKVTL